MQGLKKIGWRYWVWGGFCFLLLPVFSGLAQEITPNKGKVLEPERPAQTELDPFSEKNSPKIEASPELFKAASSEEKNLFGQAKASFEQGNEEIARSSLEIFLLSYPKSPLVPDAYLLLSGIYVSRGKLNRASELLKVFVESFPEEPRLLSVKLRLSRIYFQLNELKKIMGLWDGIPDDSPLKVSVYDKLINTYAARNDHLASVHVLMKKRGMFSEKVNPLLVEQEILAVIRERLDEGALQSLVKEFGVEFPADEALIRLIHLYDAKGDYHREEREARRFLSQFPIHGFVGQARHLLDQIQDKIKTNRYLVAVILPLSGQLAAFGNNALLGAELAAQLFKEELPGASVGLVVRDSEEDPSRLRVTLDVWLKDYQPVAVVGPLLSKDVNHVAPVIQKAGLALITPGATSSNLVSLGNSVFRNAVTNRFLCNAIAEYAVSEFKAKRFAVLFPDEPLGQRWVDCFSEGVERLGGKVVLTEKYPLDDTDFSKAILRLKKADLKQEGLIEEIKNEQGKVEKLYTPGFEAIFLPADAVRAGLIIPQLLFHEFNSVKVLGTSSWNSPEFLKLAGTYADGVVFADGFFKESSDPEVQKFVQQYRTRFHQEPDLFAAQTYDAVRLILAALKRGALTPERIRTAITETVDFPGASGFIYEILGGEFIKEPFYIRVEQGKLRQLN